MNSWAQSEGQPGLGYILFFDRAKDETTLAADPNATGVGARGPLANNIGPERAEAIRDGSWRSRRATRRSSSPAIRTNSPNSPASRARKSGRSSSSSTRTGSSSAWIVDFPMFEWNEDEKKIDFSHNPFSMPQGGLEALTSKDPLTIKAFQYDVACNGYELASGGIRNHRPEAMVKAFEIAGYGEETVIERFGGMYRAFHYGAPPHGGMAAGVDRIVMLLAGEQNLREVALFPMNQRAEDLLDGRARAGDAEAVARAAHSHRPAGEVSPASSGHCAVARLGLVDVRRRMIANRSGIRGIAQPGSAEVLGTSGRRFKSCCPDHRIEDKTWGRHDRSHLSARPQRHAVGAGER